MKPVAKSFRATLERLKSRLNWVVIHVPLDVPRIWRTRERLKVKGEINGFPFRTSLFPTGKGRHMMLVNKQMQKGGKVSAGSVAQFRLEPDTEPRIVIVPAELTSTFSGDRQLRRWFDRLLAAFSRLRVQPTNLLPAGMEITSYNHHAKAP